MFYSDLGWVVLVDTINLPVVGVGVVLGDEGLLGITSTGDDGTSAFAKLMFSNVDLRGCVVGGRAVDCIEVSIVGSVLNLDLSVR